MHTSANWMIRANGQQSNKLNLIIVEEEGNDIGENNKPKNFRRFKNVCRFAYK